ncbi:helix-turn-helix domain-containing protein [Microcella sp.]|uniref:helix-turn-helix domain-containing protein n=1 Tax=Microcella sp. TaxID=1913979 RepID=UPI00256556A2|nr:AraC family transcriptional regulator [Microcella sp.]MBX9471922.1 AraC family transcriptional regulator [Microcella sp.]
MLTSSLLGPSSTSVLRRLDEFEFVQVVALDLDDYEQMRAEQGEAELRAVVDAFDTVVRSVAHAVAGPKAAVVIPIDPDAWVVSFHSHDAQELSQLVTSFIEAVVPASTGSLLTVTAGVGKARSGESKFDMSLKSAFRAMERKLVEGGNSVYEDHPVFSSEAEFAALSRARDRFQSELLACIRTADAERAVQAATGWIEFVSASSGSSPDLVRQATVAAMIFVADNSLAAADIGGEAEDRVRKNLEDSRQAFTELGILLEAHDLSYLTLWLSSYLRRVISKHSSDERSPLMNAVETYLRQNYASAELQLSDVAKAVHASPFYISHLFQREMQTTFLKYVTNLRTEHGRRLLETTDLPIEVIAHGVGYGSARRFRELFKKSTGLSPREYRERIGRPELDLPEG